MSFSFSLSPSLFNHVCLYRVNLESRDVAAVVLSTICLSASLFLFLCPCSWSHYIENSDQIPIPIFKQTSTNKPNQTKAMEWGDAWEEVHTFILYCTWHIVHVTYIKYEEQPPLWYLHLNWLTLLLQRREEKRESVKAKPSFPCSTYLNVNVNSHRTPRREKETHRDRSGREGDHNYTENTQDLRRVNQACVSTVSIVSSVWYHV